VITSIGPWKFAAVSSDNAGNTRKARKLLCERSPNILNLQDACHLLNLAIKAIVLLPEFEEITYQIRGILAFMSRSSYAMENFDSQRVRLGISRGLEGIGETRFGTIYWAGRSLQRGLPALRAIVEDAVLGITIGVCDLPTFNNQFVDGREKLEFEFELAKFLSVIAPWAKALKCLEGAHITPDTVYLYWLAIIATIEEDLKRNPYKLRTSTMEEIRAITNSRFEEMIEDAPNDTYIVAFFLNP
ncbi:ribonuclease H-like domain-containing protein, partial [Boletus edulis]